MLTKDLIEELAHIHNLKISESKKFIECFFETLINSINENTKIEFRHFGRFRHKKYKSFVGRNPKRNCDIFVPEKNWVLWKQSRELIKFDVEGD